MPRVYASKCCSPKAPPPPPRGLTGVGRDLTEAERIILDQDPYRGDVRTMVRKPKEETNMTRSLQKQGPLSIASRKKSRLGRTAIGGGLGVGAVLLVSLVPSSLLLVGGFVCGAWFINRVGKK